MRNSPASHSRQSSPAAKLERALAIISGGVYCSKLKNKFLFEAVGLKWINLTNTLNEFYDAARLGQPRSAAVRPAASAQRAASSPRRRCPPPTHNPWRAPSVPTRALSALNAAPRVGQVPHLQRDRRRAPVPGLQGPPEEDGELRRHQAHREGPDGQGRQRGPDDARALAPAHAQVLRLVRARRAERFRKPTALGTRRGTTSGSSSSTAPAGTSSRCSKSTSSCRSPR